MNIQMKFMRYTDIKKMNRKKKIMLALAAGSLCLLCSCQSKTDAETFATVESEETSIESSEQDAITQTVVDEEEADSQSTADVSCEEDQKKKPEPVKVKGIYVSGPVAGIDRMDELIALVDETELNALVIDVKNDEGHITYKMQTDTVVEIEAGIRYISDIDALIQKCKEKNSYLIARIVAFKDPYLAGKCPELAVKTKDGQIFKDKSGLAWVNPYKKEVWEYLLEVAKEAARIGFDEIQFDYIRFSTDLKSDNLDFGPEAENKSKTEVISEFTKYACEELEDSQVYVSADVYGTIIDNKVDQAIVGQDYVEMASYLDYICPMVYPSHYGNGVYGIDIPDAEPYRTVNAAMNAAAKELSVLPEEQRAINRVWIQSFTATWVNGHITYGPEQIREQIHGAYGAGYDEWILWNASIKYQPESLLTEEEAQAEQEVWEKEKQQAQEARLEEEKKAAEEAAKKASEVESQTAEIESSEAETAETQSIEIESTQTQATEQAAESVEQEISE